MMRVQLKHIHIVYKYKDRTGKNKLLADTHTTINKAHY
jgi:hypothetical protein